jgi:peptide chain release factor 2
MKIDSLPLGGLFDLDKKNKEIEALENEMADPNFWNDQKSAQKVITKLNLIKKGIERFETVESQLVNIQDLHEMLKEDFDEEVQELIEDEIKTLQKDFEEYELSLLLDGEFDANNAILEFHPGAGGTESQDWGEMLVRMYMRWADKRGYKVDTIDYQTGDEAGIKSVTLAIKGENAYGYLRSEKGVHRLVRISPFDSSGRRHTSFASVEVMPEINDDAEIDIKTEDLKIDTYRSSGAGGQSVNTTDSAVRITHLPTNTIVTCQNERSQIKNREQAMKLLKSKLIQLEIEKKQEELTKIRGEQKEIGWGSQIRSYVFHPYSMVKDHRTNAETGNTNAVMDGGIDIFIDSYLRMKL